jgi:hypothetical protein
MKTVASLGDASEVRNHPAVSYQERPLLITYLGGRLYFCKYFYLRLKVDSTWAK